MSDEATDANQAPSTQPGSASSPYATGGGGVSFAHRVATVYLASILTGTRRSELDELAASALSFQTAPTHAVDDLLVTASGDGRQVEVAVACRATPNFVPSSSATADLIKSVIAELRAHEAVTNSVVIAVAGWKPQWAQVAELCDLARDHGTAATFDQVLAQQGTRSQPVRDRYQHLLNMVSAADNLESDRTQVVDLTWQVLTRLRVVGFHVQSPDLRDWTAVGTDLDSVAHESSNGAVLRDTLAVKASAYDANGANGVAANSVRRDIRGLIDNAAARTQHAWAVLDEHRRAAYASVRFDIGDDLPSSSPLKLEFSDRRNDLSQELLSVGADHGALVVTGESGTGKSALVLATVADLEAEPANDFEAVVLNLRGLPPTSISLHSGLGATTAQVLGEVSASVRVLILDGADVASERSPGLLRDLLTDAATAGLGVVVVAADIASDFLSEQVKAFHSPAPKAFTVEPLDDTDLAAVASHIPAIAGVLRDAPQTSLMRRLVVLDLLSRTGTTLDHPMREWECLQLIWKTVVRGDGRPVPGSPEARERTLLELAKAELEGADPKTQLVPEAVDALRADHLLAPHSTFHDRPRFAHDEVRRYATAIYLVRAGNLPEAVHAAGTPRWALSSATLACKGQLSNPDSSSPAVFADLVRGFRSLARAGAPRWADVPVEAVLDTDNAYECLQATVGATAEDLQLAEVLRVVEQRLTVAAQVGPTAEPVIRLLLDEPTPWLTSKAAFEVLTNWLRTMSFVGYPQGHELRIALRSRLLDFWGQYPLQPEVEPELSLTSVLGRRPRRRRKRLAYQLTDEEFVESLAMLGKDTNAETEACLRTIAEDAPAFLAPAADSPFGAASLAQYDPEFLAELMEAYYIDDDLEDGWSSRAEGIRGHQGRWTFVGPPFNAYYFGGFWTLFRTANLNTSIRVLNRILNHAARARVRTITRLGNSLRAFDLTDPEDEDFTGAVLDLDGEPRNYVGDSHVWSWYRGTSVGPYPCMSALQAMERLLDQIFKVDGAIEPIVSKVLADCGNLAVPGMLYGLLVRHIENAGTSLDTFLAEPEVWSLEFGRCVNEHYGFKADSEGLTHPERRAWTPREVCITLVTRAGDEDRRDAVKAVGDKLIENGARMGLQPEMVKTWAAHLDPERFRLTREGDDTYLVVEPPEEAVAANEPLVAQQEHVNATLRIQNRYSKGIYDHEYVPPTAAEVAADLTAVRELLETPTTAFHLTPHAAAAMVIRNAIWSAAQGIPEALGDESSFVVQSVLEVAETFRDGPDQRDEGQYYEIGPDRSMATALPALLTPNLADALADAGATREQVADLGLVIAFKAPGETRLFLARACDILWATECDGDPCIHATALDWAIESARGAEIGPWDMEEQRSPRVHIDGDLLTHLQELPGDSIDIEALDPVIRATGAAATHTHCQTEHTQQLLAGLLHVQARAMVRHEEMRWTADDRGTHTLIAARALLHGYAKTHDAAPVLNHTDALQASAGLLSNFLHGLAAAGAENTTFAEAATALWPTILDHALAYATSAETNVYRQRTWGSWAAAALLPTPLTWSQGMYNELNGAPIDWVDATTLRPHIDNWLTVGRGEMRCVDALITFIKRLPGAGQVAHGIRWVATACIQGGTVTVKESYQLASWLKQTRVAAHTQGRSSEWQTLVDALVVGGNTELAPFSR